MYRRKVISIVLLTVILLALLPAGCKGETSSPASTTLFTTSTPPVQTTTSAATPTISAPVTTSSTPVTTTATTASVPTMTTTTPTTTAATTTTTPATSITPTTTTPITTPPTTVITTTATTRTTQIIRLPDMLDPKDLLPSYRYYVITKIMEGEGAGTTSTYRYEMVRDQRAEHAWKEDGSGKVTELFIIIGSDQWTYVTGQGWVKQAPDASLKPSNVSAQITAAMKDPAASKAKVEKLGQESKNNVYSAHFQIEYTVKMQVPNTPGGGTSEVDAHTTGDVWIAENLGVPSIIMFWKGTTDYTLQGKKTVVYTEQSLYDIDRVMEIALPKT